MDVDYRLAFEFAPVGLVLSRNRTMMDCNRQVCEMFGASREVLIAQVAGLLKSPIQRMAGVLAAVAEKKGGGAEAPAEAAAPAA